MRAFSGRPFVVCKGKRGGGVGTEENSARQLFPPPIRYRTPWEMAREVLFSEKRARRFLWGSEKDSEMYLKKTEFRERCTQSEEKCFEYYLKTCRISVNK